MEDSIFSLLGSYDCTLIFDAVFLIDESFNMLSDFQELNKVKISLQIRQILNKSNEILYFLSKIIEQENDGFYTGSNKSDDFSSVISLLEKMGDQISSEMSGTQKLQFMIDAENLIFDLEKLSANYDQQTTSLIYEIMSMLEKNISDVTTERQSVQTSLRQRRIVNKYLDLYDAVMENEYDSKRESSVAKNTFFGKSDNLSKEIIFENDIEVIEKKEIKLYDFYLKKHEKYMINNEKKTDN